MLCNLRKNIVGRFFESSSHKNKLLGSQTVQIESDVRGDPRMSIARKRHWSSAMSIIKAGCQWIRNKANTAVAVEAGGEQPSQCSHFCTRQDEHYYCTSMATRREVMAVLYPLTSPNIPFACDPEPIPPAYKTQSIPEAQDTQPPCTLFREARELEPHIPTWSYPLSPLEPTLRSCPSAPSLQTKPHAQLRPQPYKSDTGVESLECDEEPPAYSQSIWDDMSHSSPPKRHTYIQSDSSPPRFPTMFDLGPYPQFLRHPALQANPWVVDMV